MFVELTDYHGQLVKLEATNLLKLRPALANVGDPDGCTLVDWGEGGVFALGNIQTIAGLFAPHMRLAVLHAPDGTQIYPNADAIQALMTDDEYAGACVAVVGRDFQNPRVPARNRIGLLETVEVAKQILDAARLDQFLVG